MAFELMPLLCDAGAMLYQLDYEAKFFMCH